MNQTLTSQKRRARKQHRCSDCGLVIPKGSEYHFATVAGDGTVWSWREHLECHDIAQEALMIGAMDIDDWWGLDSFYEALQERGVDLEALEAVS